MLCLSLGGLSVIDDLDGNLVTFSSASLNVRVHAVKSIDVNCSLGSLSY